MLTRHNDDGSVEIFPEMESARRIIIRPPCGSGRGLLASIKLDDYCRFSMNNQDAMLLLLALREATQIAQKMDEECPST